MELVTIRDGIPVTTSRIIAKEFGKEHKNVKRDIEQYLMSSNLSALREWFILSSYKDSRGREQEEYLITEEGAMFLIMGYEGEKAGLIKIKFIEIFKSMREALAQPKQETFALVSMEQLTDVKQRLDQMTTYVGVVNQFLADVDKDMKAVKKDVKVLKVEMEPEVDRVPKFIPYRPIPDLSKGEKGMHPDRQVAIRMGIRFDDFNQVLKELKIHYRYKGKWRLYKKDEDKGYAFYNAKTRYWTDKGRKMVVEKFKARKDLEHYLKK